MTQQRSCFLRQYGHGGRLQGVLIEAFQRRRGPRQAAAISACHDYTAMFRDIQSTPAPDASHGAQRE